MICLRLNLISQFLWLSSAAISIHSSGVTASLRVTELTGRDLGKGKGAWGLGALIPPAGVILWRLNFTVWHFESQRPLNGLLFTHKAAAAVAELKSAASVWRLEST